MTTTTPIARLVDSVSDLLTRYRVFSKVLSKNGEGSIDGPASFQIFGRGADNRQLMLDVFLRLLVATEKFAQPIHVCRTYKVSHKKGTPELVHGYTIAGACKDSAEVKELMAALDLQEWYEGVSTVDEALFWQLDTEGNPIPSSERNMPRSSSSTPDGKRGVWLYSHSKGGA